VSTARARGERAEGLPHPVPWHRPCVSVFAEKVIGDAGTGDLGDDQSPRIIRVHRSSAATEVQTRRQATLDRAHAQNPRAVHP
jgi:hypothetical protein